MDMFFKERASKIRRVSKIDDAGEVLSLDYLLVTPQVWDVWHDRITVDWQGMAMSIVSRSGLLKMKDLAGRPKDLIDIDRMQNEDSWHVVRGNIQKITADRTIAKAKPFSDEGPYFD